MTAVKPLSFILPQPQYNDAELDRSTANRDDTSSVDTRLALKVREVPPYGRRSGWIPRTLDDFGDGGAFPEIHTAQYPLEMGKPKGVIFLKTTPC